MYTLYSVYIYNPETGEVVYSNSALTALNEQAVRDDIVRKLNDGEFAKLTDCRVVITPLG